MVNPGLDMSDQWKHLPEVADELCNYRGCYAESLNHPEALFHMNTGSRLGGDPALGCKLIMVWALTIKIYPGYVVMTELALPQGGSRNWSNGFLPGQYQGTRLRPTGSPILDLKGPSHKIVPIKDRLSMNSLSSTRTRQKTSLPQGVGNKNEKL